MMEAERWRKVDELLNAALAVEPSMRGKFLDESGADGLRGEVESLLACEAKTDGFLASAAISFSSDFFDREDIADPLIGQRIGNYKITGELGRGGMGAVYLAERDDGKFDQQVAVKLLKRELNTEDIRRRFSHERQILASLSHPNIARLLDAGTTDDGLPFIVMEYVEGSPINQFCEVNNLALNARLELFQTVCEAVAFAHRNLIVHRDLKPSNIFVTRDGQPKLLDFGISKLLTPEGRSDSANTVTKLGAMTPEYASPEQIRGASVTTATDVYSLGVILYELLTNHRPFAFAKGNPEEIFHAVLETDPRPPSSVVVAEPKTRSEKSTDDHADLRTKHGRPDTNFKFQISNLKSLRGDLDNIVLKALKKEPERRYSSVEQFADDIRRHLADLPVLARPDTLRYRAGKFIHRNKIAAAAALIIALTLVGGIAATLWQARRAEANQARAEKRFNDVRRLSNALLFEITPKIERLDGSLEARQILVGRSLEYLDSLSQEAGDDLTLQGELASAYEKIAGLQYYEAQANLGDPVGALASLEKAQGIRRNITAALPSDSENRRLLAENLRHYGKVMLATRNKFDAAVAIGDEAARIYNELIRESPDSLPLRLGSIEIRSENAQGHGDAFQYEKAAAALREIAGELDTLRASHPNDKELLRILAKTQAYLGYDLAWNDQPAEAHIEMTRAISIAESLVAAYPGDANLRQNMWVIYYFAAGIYEDVENDRSLALAEKAMKFAEQTMTLEAGNIQARVSYAKNLQYIGQLSAKLKNTAVALEYLERSRRAWIELIDKNPGHTPYMRSLALCYQMTGDAKYNSGDLAGAMGEFEKTLEINEKISAEDPTNLEALRDRVLARKSVAYIHHDYANAASGEKRKAHGQSAKQNYQLALDVLLRLHAMGNLAEVDRKLLAEMQAAVQKFP